MDRTQRIADAYCARVARRLQTGERAALVVRARRNLDLMASKGTASPRLLAPWHEALADAGRLDRALTADDPNAAALRRNHPFAGALPERERQDIVREAFRAA